MVTFSVAVTLETKPQQKKKEEEEEEDVQEKEEEERDCVLLHAALLPSLSSLLRTVDQTFFMYRFIILL